MSELKSGIFTLAIFIAFVVPLLLTTGIGSIHQHSFMKVSSEFTEIVKEEGGITPHVNEVAGRLKSRGYTIAFRDMNGNSLSGRGSYGDQIMIDYKYKYNNVRGEQSLNTKSYILLARR